MGQFVTSYFPLHLLHYIPIVTKNIISEKRRSSLIFPFVCKPLFFI
ncbi:hypothetical protein HMPREF3182_01315 [Megasphaera hutchinsoni]|uniref:Uncharacterized protein n=1 Tax=Megasphaera hutchinsoni TaxID=1588748 RepID=A0A134CEG2_9FIRM|nr:hypothetical protein HMPREF3182_01315 [Megasphaera hutchinsoni]